MAMELIGEGREKKAYSVKNEVWALNKEDSESKHWAEASLCLHQIIYELFPNNFPRLHSLEHLMEDAGDSVKKRILRTMEKIPGKAIHPLLGQFYKKRINAISDQLEAAGALSVLDPVPQNFIPIKKDGQSSLVYVDTLNPYTLNSENQPLKRTVDVQKLKETIEQRFHTPDTEITRNRLLRLLTIYEELTKGLDTALPQSYWREQHK